MFYRLLILNWKIFVSNLNRFQLLLLISYILFLGIMLVNLTGTAIMVSLLGTEPWTKTLIPWITPEIRLFLLLVFANFFWLLHFSFTNIRLLNLSENRKLLGFGFPVRKLTVYLLWISFFHPVNLIYNFTWIVFLMTLVTGFYQVPVVLAAVVFNYVLIFSVKHRFIQVVERRFLVVAAALVFIIFGLFEAVTFLVDNSARFILSFIPQAETLNNVFLLLPGGLMLRTAVFDYGWLNAAVVFVFLTFLSGLILIDHYNKTREGLQKPLVNKVVEEKSRLWGLLRKVFGLNAGKYYYYVLKHPYNKLQVLTLVVIPVIYVPLLTLVDYEIVRTVLIPTILAGIPVALLAMGMANMYGYENRELLLHLQFPVSLEQQLKERFLGVILLPLMVFYIITIFELIMLPEIGSVMKIFVGNTFFFLCFMLIFLWSSYYQYQKAVFSAFSYKHPIIPQKVTFVITFSMFIIGYLVFVPLGDLEWYRITIMSVVIVVIGFYLWGHMNLLVSLFKKRVLYRLWAG